MEFIAQYGQATLGHARRETPQDKPQTNHTTPHHTTTMKTVEETIKGTQKALSNKIKACKTRKDLRSAEKQCERMYDAGCLSVYAYMMLDNMIMRRLALLED